MVFIRPSETPHPSAGVFGHHHPLILSSKARRADLLHVSLAATPLRGKELLESSEVFMRAFPLPPRVLVGGPTLLLLVLTFRMLSFLTSHRN